MISLPRILRDDDYIQEGASPAHGIVVLACTVGDDYDNPKNRILLGNDKGWLEFGSSGEPVISIDASPDGSGYVLGENGTAIRFSWRASTTEELRASRALLLNPAVAEIGPLGRIRVLGRDVVSVGTGGQAYRLRKEMWEALPPLRVGDEDLTIEDVAGPSSTDFLAVTSEGFAASFRGSSWHQLDLPTNAAFSSVCRAEDNFFAVAGENGTIVTGRAQEWRVADTLDDDRKYWGIAAKRSRVYAAYLGGIDICEQDRVFPLVIPDGLSLEYTALCSGPDGIWSFAGKTIGLITEEGWRTVLSP